MLTRPGCKKKRKLIFHELLTVSSYGFRAPDSAPMPVKQLLLFTVLAAIFLSSPPHYPPPKPCPVCEMTEPNRERVASR
jgi:hypothetical protein